jgi:AcrR family transcriptional regulator
MARTGRRRGPSTTRATILRVAARRFADGGYDATSLRGIAAEAGVDPAVVVHFFGSKDGLFQAAVGWPFDPSSLLLELVDGTPEANATHLARAFFGFWDDPTTGPVLLALLRSAMTHDASAALLREFLNRRLFVQISGLFHAPDAELRVDLAAGQLIGLALLRYALRVEPIASATVEELVDRCAPALAVFLGSARESGPESDSAHPTSDDRSRWTDQS